MASRTFQRTSTSSDDVWLTLDSCILTGTSGSHAVGYVYDEMIDTLGAAMSSEVENRPHVLKKVPPPDIPQNIEVKRHVHHELSNGHVSRWVEIGNLKCGCSEVWVAARR